MAGGAPLPPGVHLRHLLHHLKEPGAARDAIGFQRGGDGQADGFFRAAFIRHHQIGGHGVQTSLHALYTGVK